MAHEVPKVRDYPINEIVPGQLVHYPELAAVQQCHRGWVAGPYIKGLEGIPFEVKCEVQQKGDERAEWSEPAPGETFVLVLSGATTICYLIDGEEKRVTVSAGQSIHQSNAIPHKWVVLEDNTMVVTVRLYGST